ncbi:acetyl/propionyl/methylcrotonyl-CoA carboxylase subunit alpha [Amycolatopsis alkalitolerans]|uniref:biotin carboxylase n=1 Tax=Amycolatopsis alkalitolerans TaxID=2547244 RepID=A0A5C4LWW2_9PSEU|nr:biotin carboxylase N-terminal domain-containing protein [Amycolatopsis alkalitolerans]TNC23779.1 ATP-grasp domain-containing protein [Amycolatopsis alkalitolerans]
MTREFGKVLVANRGEIAVRVIRACRDAGLVGVAVYADQDTSAPHVRLADEAYALHGATAAETYLDIDKLLDVAKATGSDAVHPGYGFLSENAGFAEAVIGAGLTWVGPPPEAIRALGDKVTARRIAARVGAPLVAGTADPVSGADEVVAFARRHGLPVAIKASFGGGGRGLRVAYSIEEIPELFESTVREAAAAFGRGECFVERYLERPRHVEAQVLADEHGTVVVVGTRDCSLQRRHQKLVEEAPAPFLTDEQRATIHSSAQAICREAGYRGAGTVEYLLAADGTISFLEVNTRLQVEHPVTEETTGVDLVREQFRIAAGMPLSLTADPRPSGHAFEFRINGEDPGSGFLPTPGRITRLRLPEGPGIRLDSGVEEGSVVGGAFDSLLAKLIVSGPDRDTALARSRRALAELDVAGVATVLPFHRAVVRDPAFTGRDTFAVHTRWVETEFDNRIEPYRPEAEQDGATVTVLIGGRPMRVPLPGLRTLGSVGERILAQAEEQALGGHAAAVAGDLVTTPMQGTVVKVAVTEGQHVTEGELVAVVEAMKMENPVSAHRCGVVHDLAVQIGDTPAQGAVLCRIDDEEGAPDAG